MLLHPTALPGKYGIGDIGPEAYQLVDFLDAAKQRYWQVLPLGSVDRGGGPYGIYSAFAGDPLLIGPELMREDGLLASPDLEAVPDFPESRVDFPAVFESSSICRSVLHSSEAKADAQARVAGAIPLIGSREPRR